MKAISGGIIRDVVESTGCTKTKASRTFSGGVKRPDPVIVKALNDWLSRNGLPVVDANGKTARNHINELRSSKAPQGE